MKNQSAWMWYPGDFEIFHALRVNTRREERAYMWPAFWRLDDCWHNVRFRKSVELEKEETICCYTNGLGHVIVDSKKYPFKHHITLMAGAHEIIIATARIRGLPSVYIENESPQGVIVSGAEFEANYYDEVWQRAGSNDLFLDKNDDPEVFPFQYKELVPVSTEQVGSGLLYDFGRETFAAVSIKGLELGDSLDIYYGESRTEALDIENCYLYEKIAEVKNREIELETRAFRYIYICGSNTADIGARYEYLPLKTLGKFKCSDEKMNRIWEIAEYTFHLNSREFFLDGIKRDRWIWSGDAYQSYKINQYLYFDKDICKRTILALRGKDPVSGHINTITDYSLFWVISIWEYYECFKELEFVKMVYSQMKSLMDFCISRTDDNGFIVKRGEDWIFIDWADIDKEGAVCAEQILFAKSLECMVTCSRLLGRAYEKYQTRYEELCKNINIYFWDQEKKAYISSFQSGRRQVTRHANIFAVLFDFADETKKKQIVDNVIYNKSIPQIVTPYFKFFELDVMGKLGEYEYICAQIKDYWGGMVDKGATTFWETYDPEDTKSGQYEMYGDPYGKSLCHAWGASPIYLLGRYFMGVESLTPGYERFRVKPQFLDMEWVKAEIPIANGMVWIESKKGKLDVTASRAGGILGLNGKEIG